jgi:hypothetical protein
LLKESPDQPVSADAQTPQVEEDFRYAIGRIGGKPRLKGKILTAVFVTAVLAAFTMSLLTQGITQIMSIDIGLLLLSLKLAYHLHTEAKVNHAQFWILTTIEDRLLNVISELRAVKQQLRDSPPITGNCPLARTPVKEPQDPHEED